MPAIRPKILVFSRPYLIDDFKENTDPLKSEFDFTFLTDGAKAGTRDTRIRFYQRMESALQSPHMTNDDESDAIDRCRFLRNINPAQALKMVRAMASVLDEELEQINPKAIFAQMVDEYITHLLSILARKRGIVYIGIAYSYFPGVAQATLHSNGEPFEFRKIEASEVERIYSHISVKSFRQDYQQPSAYTLATHLQAMLRYGAKKFVFASRKVLERDPLNLHYGCLPYIAARNKLRNFPVRTDFDQNWNKKLSIARASSKKTVYFPLAYYPEATINYWITNRKILNYDTITLEICRELAKHFNVVVKEHLHMFGCRNTDFYKAIKAIAGVISVPPLEYSNEVADQADIVILGGGSIGVESYLRGKPVVTFCETSYWFEKSKAAYMDLSNLPSVANVIFQQISSHKNPDEKERRTFLKNCLSSTFQIAKSGKFWPICKTEDLYLALTKAVNIEGSR
jgi:hypothetical protein